MLARKPWALNSLHQPPSNIPILVPRTIHSNIAPRLLHDDTKDDALFDADLGSVDYGVEDAANILAAVAGLEHGGFVDVEEGVEVLPGGFGGEIRGGAGVRLERHGFYVRCLSAALEKLQWTLNDDGLGSEWV